MRNIRIILQYEGTKYQGWQKQTSSDNTIQGKLEKLLERMCGVPTEISGSGRTDAGVHALGQVANFHCEIDMTTEEIQEYMNRYLPEDIAVIRTEEVAPRFHSRLNAVRKCYRYQVWNREVPNVFLRRYCLEDATGFDCRAMREAAEILCGEHDFQAFTSAKKGKKSTVRTIERIIIEENAGGQEGLLSFTFIGDGFLYHMIRILMGTLLEVGSGERSVESVRTVLEGKDRSAAGKLVPAKGLTLVEVSYH